MEAFDLGGDPVGLGGALVEQVGLHGPGVLGGTRRRRTPGQVVGGEEAPSPVEDRRRNPETDGQLPPAGVGTEDLGKLGDVLDPGTSERVGRLGWFSGRGQVVAGSGGLVDERHLGGRQVLVLVDQHEWVILAHAATHGLVREEVEGVEQEGRVVDLSELAEGRPVPLQEAGERAPQGVSPGTLGQSGRVDPAFGAAE